MKQLKIYALSLLMVFSVSILTAQNDPKADKVVKESKSKFESLKNISADFTYTLSNPSLEKSIVKKGSLLMAGKKYQIKFEEEEFYCNAQDVWIVLLGDKEVTISEYDSEEGLSIDRIYKIYEEDTKTKYEGDMGSSHKISVFLQDEKSDIWKAELWVSKSSKLINKAVLYGRNGSNYTYQLTNVKTNTSVSDSDFMVDTNSDEYADFYINDLR